MKKALSTVKMQSPFLETKLMLVSRFISYCKDNGVDTSKEELESLHKQGLLFPAVKVHRGTCKHKKIYASFTDSLEWKYVDPKNVSEFKPKKIDKQTYYSAGSFMMGSDGWLDHYKKHNMLEYPASQRFKKWNTKFIPGFVTKESLFKDNYEFFYDKTQLLNLKVIYRERNFWQYFKGEEQQKLIELAKQNLVDLMIFLQFYIEVLEYFDVPNKLIAKNMDMYVKDGMSKEQIDETLQEDYDLDIKPLIKKRAKEVMEKHSFNADQVDYWRIFLSMQGVFGESRRSLKCIRTYLNSIDEKDIIRAEYTNYMIFVLNRFMLIFNGENKTVKQIIENSRRPRCCVCGIEFDSKKYTQKTCGTLECKQENKNSSKRKRP